MRRQPPEARDYFLACYTVSLVQGETILGSPVRHSTIKNYLKAAQELIGKNVSCASQYQFTDTILKAVENYEEVPKRRRMITDKMSRWLVERAAGESRDSAARAIVDWFILGRYAGFRAAEWSQTTQGKYARIEHWPGEPSRAFIRNDFTFLAEDERRLSSEDLSERLIGYLIITWRIQKNGQNGEQITFGRDDKSPAYSPTNAGFRIYERSKRLGMKDYEPMAVYRNSHGKVRFITDTMVNDLLRQAASATLGIPRNNAELKLWSTHSIRVTAANLLYRMQLSDQYIMTRLRWLSAAFLVYLRNTIHSADAHTKAASIKLTPADKKRASYRNMDAVEKVVSMCTAAAPSVAH